MRWGKGNKDTCNSGARLAMRWTLAYSRRVKTELISKKIVTNSENITNTVSAIWNQTVGNDLISSYVSSQRRGRNI